jgi:hypothetical protein
MAPLTGTSAEIIPALDAIDTPLCWGCPESAIPLNAAKGSTSN